MVFAGLCDASISADIAADAARGAGWITYFKTPRDDTEDLVVYDTEVIDIVAVSVVPENT